jgi:hypothetical protein
MPSIEPSVCNSNDFSFAFIGIIILVAAAKISPPPTFNSLRTVSLLLITIAPVYAPLRLPELRRLMLRSQSTALQLQVGSSGGRTSVSFRTSS